MKSAHASYRIVPLMVLALIVALLGPALANQEGAVDPDDTAGRLDVQSVMHGHRGTDRDRLWHLVKMQGPWRSQALRGAGSHISMWFSTDREDRFAERRIWIDWHNGELRADIEIYDEFSDGASVSPIRRLQVRRPSPRTLKVFFDSEDLGRDLSSYKWSVTTNYRKTGTTNCSRDCFDSAPDGPERGKVEHNI